MGSLMATHSAAVLAWSALVAMAVQPSGADSWVQGVVYEKAGRTTRPLTRAFVSVWSSGGELLSTTRTNATGRYRFANLPQGRLALEASKPGYLTQQAAGRAGPRAILDCSTGCRQSGMDFELSLGAVVSGVVSDGMLEPVSRAVVFLRRIDASASGEKPLTGATDDRGRFRIAGLRPGKYTLTVQGRASRGQDEVLTKTLNVGEGEGTLDLSLALGSHGSFRVAGSVSGIPFGEGYRTWVDIRPLSGSGKGRQASVGQDGRFRFDSVAEGRYRADAAVVQLGNVERKDHFLDVLEVTGDVDGITLQPVEPATVAGTMEVAAGAMPAGVAAIRFTSRDGFGYRQTRVRGAERQFELSGVRPGVYRVEAGSAQFYVKGVKTTGEIESSGEVVLAPGLNRLTVVAAADQAQVLGTVLDPKTGQPLPHARVALHGNGAKYSVQADQTGRFLIGNVIPGDEYRLCAWTNVAPESVEDLASWEQSGCQPVTIPITPSSQTEIDIPASQ